MLNISGTTIRWIIGTIIGIIMGLFNPSIRRYIGIDPSPLCMTSSCHQQYSRLANKAKQKISHLQSDVPIRFPLGVNRPVTLKNGSPNSSQGWEAIGFVNRSGTFKAITGKDLHQIFDRHLEKIKVVTLAPQKLILASTRNEFLTTSSSRVAIIDLIARNTQTGQISLLPNVDYISFFKDALNAALNSEVKTHNINLQALQNRMTRSNQQTTEQTPQEQEIPSIPKNRIDIYRNAQQEVCKMSEESEDINLAIPLGSNNPISIGQIPNDNRLNLANSVNFEAVGFVNSSGQAHPITAGDICDMIMLQASMNSGGSFDASAVDASGSFLQARRVSVIDLIARDQRNGKYYLLPNVRVDSFGRDAVNAFFNSTWRKNDIDVRNLRIRNIEE
ncbi:MAG: hypothetical protein QNJ65_10925 [Xenococcaceae cyanobacterium MO_234.B1]|nr:hypothetical protein [Xenococcaceae cyanobacterium MO_234.B1]